MSKYTLAYGYAARTTAYRFTIEDLDDPSLKALREQAKRLNISRKKFEAGPYYKTPYPQRYKVSIKPRGPRNGHYFVTPKENATHYDVYLYLTADWQKQIIK